MHPGVEVAVVRQEQDSYTQSAGTDSNGHGFQDSDTQSAGTDSNGHGFQLYFDFEELKLDNEGSDQTASLYVMHTMPGEALVHQIYHMLKEQQFTNWNINDPSELTLRVHGEEVTPDKLTPCGSLACILEL